MKSTAEEWRFGYLLPHINFSAPIENEFVALVPDSDQRLAGLAASQEALQAKE